MKMIDTKAHGTIDYALSLLLLCFPYMLSLKESTPQVNVFYFTGAALLIYNALTKFEVGLLPLLAVRLHFLLDVVAGLILIASPWIFGFSSSLSVPHLVMGAVLMIMPILTDINKKDNALINP